MVLCWLWADPIGILKIQLVISFSKQQLQGRLRVIVFFKTIQIISTESHIMEWLCRKLFNNSDRSFIKRQTSGTSSDSKWWRVVQRVTTSGTTSGNKWYNEWQRVVQRVTTSGTKSSNEWQRVTANMAISDSEWQQWYNKWKRHSTLQKMYDCRPFNDKNRYTSTSRNGWLQLEWLNK